MSRTVALSYLRATATGERHQSALRALRALDPWQPLIAQASDGQARLESLFLGALDRFDRVYHSVDPPFGIAWCTPAIGGIEISVARPHLRSVLAAVLPSSFPEADLRGIPGLRVHHYRRHLVLEHLRLSGRIRIPMTSGQWHRALPWLSARVPAGTEPAWFKSPTALTQEEEDGLSSGLAVNPGTGAGETCAVMSALLRRLQLLRRAPLVYEPFENVWLSPVRRNDSGARLINLEWGSKPTSRELAQQLTDPSSPLALPERLRGCCQDTGLGRMQLSAPLGTQILLRHNPVGGTAQDVVSGPHRPPRRATARGDELAVLDLVIDALSGDRPLVDREELHIARRPNGGWDVRGPSYSSPLLEHLRQLAHTRTYRNLWPQDLEDMLELPGGPTVVQVRGVEVVFHDPEH